VDRFLDFSIHTYPHTHTHTHTHMQIKKDQKLECCWNEARSVLFEWKYQQDECFIPKAVKLGLMLEA